MGLPDDLELAKRACRGDDGAFETIVARYERQVYNLALRTLLDPEDARDVTQEVFVRVYEKLPSFRGESSFSTWLYRITVNLCVDAIRERQKNWSYSLDAPYLDRDAPLQVPQKGPSVEDEVESRVLVEKIADALGDLSPEHRTMLVLAHIKGLSYEEISEITGVPMGTVKSRLARARWALKRLLSGSERPCPGSSTTAAPGGNRKNGRRETETPYVAATEAPAGGRTGRETATPPVPPVNQEFSEQIPGSIVKPHDAGEGREGK
ncbi:MAG: sigma-70 family RNA polymerase sigma factor [Firmicutes bacterium]|nr:sigma-70 family RNA polymerase sigma factor [Candidatus Fermentithermobacillaceae bacterium]